MESRNDQPDEIGPSLKMKTSVPYRNYANKACLIETTPTRHACRIRRLGTCIHCQQMPSGVFLLSGVLVLWQLCDSQNINRTPNSRPAFVELGPHTSSLRERTIDPTSGSHQLRLKSWPEPIQPLFRRHKYPQSTFHVPSL